MSARLRTVLVAVTALLWTGLIVVYRDSWVLPAYLVLAAGLVVLSAIDVREHRLPNRIVYPLTVAVAALLVVAAVGDDDGSALGRALLAGAVAVAAFAGLHLASPRSLGLGDVKLVGVLGMALGWLAWAALAWARSSASPPARSWAWCSSPRDGWRGATTCPSARSSRPARWGRSCCNFPGERGSGR